MSEPNSITMLGEWLATFRALDADVNTTEEEVSDHLDELSHVLASMAIDFELQGLETHELKALSMKQETLRNRILSKRFTIVDDLMALSARLIRAAKLESEAQENTTDSAAKTSTVRGEASMTAAFKLHCQTTPGTHADKAKKWLYDHPADTRSEAQVAKASKRYPYMKPSKPD